MVKYISVTVASEYLYEYTYLSKWPLSHVPEKYRAVNGVSLYTIYILFVLYILTVLVIEVINLFLNFYLINLSINCNIIKSLNNVVIGEVIQTLKAITVLNKVRIMYISYRIVMSIDI